MHYEYRTHGTCSSKIAFDLNEDGTIHNIVFTGGCPGNHIGLDRLLRGMDVDEAIERMMGIKCGVKSSSCPEQVAMALSAMKAETA